MCDSARGTAWAFNGPGFRHSCREQGQHDRDAHLGRQIGPRAKRVDRGIEQGARRTNGIDHVEPDLARTEQCCEDSAPFG